jgi:hypothetical protein
MAEETQHLQAEIKSLTYKDCLGWGDPVLDELLSAGVSTESPETYPIESALDETVRLAGVRNLDPDIPVTTEDGTEDASISFIPNLAVARCVSVWSKAIKEELEILSRQEGSWDSKATAAMVKENAALAYCAAMPQLSNRQAVIDFIASVVHGMAIGAIPGARGTQLLYGAQVANSAFPPRKKRTNTLNRTSSRASILAESVT